ncbi:phage major capsid protein [Snodgrassella communis]|uniref:phage major capsid protein n=1 Tax=Snodgrassella communis TaxID=2946699 RepID=UPI000C1EA4D8|nr:phage major capsid protein [Snodgrassella communis]PIT06829.1 hypothetical protein BGI31_10825 [Snodgrassella communis]
MMKKNGKQYPYRGAIKVFAQAGGSNPAAVIDGIRSGLQEWQNKQNGEVNSLREQLSAGEKAQAELKQTITELQASYDDMAKKIAAGQMNGAGGVSPEAAARSAAMASYLRTGTVSADLTKDSDLGVVAPVEWDRTMTDKLVEISPARQLFNVIQTEKAGYKKVYNILSMLITAGYFYAHREDLGRAENAAVPVNAHNLLDLHRKRPALTTVQGSIAS